MIKLGSDACPPMFSAPAIEQGSFDLSGRAAGLDRAVINLGEIEVPVAINAGRGGRSANGGLERPVVVQSAVDAGEVAGDQPRQSGRRIDLRDEIW